MHAALLLAALAASDPPRPAPVARKKIVLLAGKKSHGPVGNGIHDYGWSAQLLKAMLDNSDIKDRVKVECHLEGWPRDPSTLDDADTILVISDGRDGHLYEEAPHLASPERVRLIDKQIKRGCGFLTFHFSTFAPNKYADEILRWSGAYFQWETNGKREWYSAITTKEAPVALGSPGHPVSRGLTPFAMREEFYYNLRFKEADTATKPIWVVPSLGGRKDGGDVVAWARERADGGRGFGTTCGHFYDNWRHDNFRKLILNALAWTAKVEVPEGGVEARFFTHEEIRDPAKQALVNVLLVAGNDAHKWHNWEKTTPRIKDALQKDERVRVDVVTDFEEVGKRELSRYQTILLNWCNWQDPKGPSDKSKQAFAKFVRDGGGLVLVHFANGAFHPSLPKAGESDWPEYRKIVRRVWNHHKRGDKPPSGHDAFGRFGVIVTKAKSPLTAGLKRFEVEDELYFHQDGDEPVEPLLVAESKVTKKLEPLAWTYHYGKGRVFQTLLGHSEKTWDAAEMRELLRRAAAWTAGAPIKPIPKETPKGRSPVLEKDKLLDGQTFWDNRDRDWFKKNIPFFGCPDPDLTTTYYYRWELMTKHLTYGSPETGYVFTEFIDRPFWSGRYGAISCPAGFQLYEARWLLDSRVANDYLRYWFRTPGAEPRRYSTWLADAAWAVHLVDPYLVELPALADLIKNHQGWEKSHFDRDVGLFWQTGHDDGMEININSRQTKDTVRGAPGYRPTLNAYLWADAVAIARIAEARGEKKTAAEFRDKAAKLKAALQEKLWDPKREFFFHMAKRDEARDGHTVKALSLTYQSGKHAGSPRGRELIGYVPWQFNMPDAGYESAWKPLMDRKGFFADFGPTTVERGDPMFLISKTCCVWSGNSWPYATTQTLKAMANLLQNYKQGVVSKADYLKLLTVYARTHRKNGKPYLAEACHPDTGSWEGHDAYNHSEHYFHSGFVDLILTGLVGLVPRGDDVVEVNPLAPEGWDYFAVDDVPYRQQRLAVVWDKTGTRYGLGKGFHLLVNGTKVASRETLGPLKATLPWMMFGTRSTGTKYVNFAVNNDGGYYPRLVPSFASPAHPVSKLNDGNFWYHTSPPNRWTFEGSPNATDSLILELGAKRPINTLKLYFLDDGEKVGPPAAFEVEYHDGKAWRAVAGQTRSPEQPEGRRANTVSFPEAEADRLRVTFTHRGQTRTGLSEVEAWGHGRLPIESPPFPTGNLAYNDGKRPFPKASASHTSRHDKVEMANDGVINYAPSPHNRWTAYESPNKTDWLEIDFGERKSVGRVELAIYDDRGGVQAPASYSVQQWDDKEWRDVASPKRTPATPVGGQINEVSFDRAETSKIRIVFTHKGKARSGVSEVLVWPERAP